MKHWNEIKLKKWSRRVLALVCALGSVLTMSICPTLAADSSADVLSECVNGVIVLFKWDPIIDAYDFPDGEYYVAMLSEKNTTWTGVSWDGSSHLPLRSNDWIPYTCNYYSRTANDIFYSVGTHGSPMIFYDAAGRTGCKNWDGDNHCPRLALWTCDVNGRPLGAVGRNGDWHLRYQPDYRNNAALDDYLNNYLAGTAPTLESMDGSTVWWSASHPHHDHDEYTCFCFIHNISGRDPSMRIASSGTVYSEREKDWGDRCYFNLWKGTPTQYSVLTKSYTISDNQTLNLNAEEENYAGVYIPKGVTLTVEKGGTLSINEKVFNDGKIINNGGTIVIQSQGRIGPFANDGKNYILVKNNGVLITMPGSRLYTREQLIFSESRLINFGTCVLGSNVGLFSSFVENREGGVLALGYNCSEVSNPNFMDVDLSGAAAGNIPGFSFDESLDNIYVYDTKGHYSTYGCFDNLGAIATNFNADNDIVWTRYETGSALREVLAQNGYR